MSDMFGFISAISGLPVETLVLILAMGVLIFAGYCVHVIHVHHSKRDK